MSGMKQECIVLTGSVIQCYRRLEKTGIQNPRERLNDYLCAIRRWLNQPEIGRVVYCDASGFLIPQEIFGDDRFRSYAVDLRSVALNQGKGPAECRTIEYLMELEDCLPQDFFKCTGRLFVANFTEIYDRLDLTLSLMGMNKEQKYADTRFYWLNRSYYRRFIRPHLDEINDYQSWYVELFYGKRCREVQSIPQPVFIGRFGHDGQVYHEDFSETEKEQAHAWIDQYRLFPASMKKQPSNTESHQHELENPTKGKIMTPPPIYEDGLVTVHEAAIGHGRLGINDPGYAALDLPEQMHPDDWLILSGHCPSTMKVTLKAKVRLKGVMNGSSVWSPVASCLFLVSDNIVGYLFGPKDATRDMILEPGDYTLEITSPDPAWKHSLWAVREIPEL